MLSYSSSKPIGGVLENWCLHDASGALSAEQWEAFRAASPGCLPAIVTAEVVEDKLNRWRPGDTMQTSKIVYFSLADMVIETENRLYRLQGPGRISKTLPLDCAHEVGVTIFFLGNLENMVVDRGSTTGLYYPVQPDSPGQ
ncbi:MAG: hypothetical protein CMN84_10815 [Spongiibacteraceae bacterium]|nr:hypothetical protein [Spongiibacteraceae bacterium]